MAVIQSAHIDTLRRLAEKAEHSAAKKAREEALTALVKALTPVINKRWPLKDMKVLARYGQAGEPKKGLKLTLGDGCSCSEVNLPGDCLGRPCPFRPDWNGVAQTLDISEEPQLVPLAEIYREAAATATTANRELREALKSLIAKSLKAGTSAKNLEGLKKVWPDPEVARVCDEVMAGEKVVAEDELMNTIATAFNKEAA